MKNIAIIGAGQLGSRHLQALANVDFPVVLRVVDPNPASLQVAEERYCQVPENSNVKNVMFVSSLEGLEGEVDLCVLATNSDIRLEVLKNLLLTQKIRYLLLEKVLFQSPQELSEARALLEKNRTEAWVNCPRRLFPFYQEIKKQIEPGEKITYSVSGGEWGLACNGIHFIDHLAWFTDGQLLDLDTSGLDPVIHQSKRPGFVELTGCLKGSFGGESHFTLEAVASSHQPLILKIQTESLRVEIDEGAGTGSLFRIENSWQEESFKFKLPFQSELTQLVARDLLHTGTCGLTPFAESASLHTSFLAALLKHLERVSGHPYNRCPIT